MAINEKNFHRYGRILLKNGQSLNNTIKPKKFRRIKYWMKLHIKYKNMAAIMDETF